MVKENISAFVEATLKASTLLKSALVKNLKDASEEQIESACEELNLTSSVLVERGLNDQALEVKEQFSIWKVDGIKDEQIYLHQGDEELSVSADSLTLEDVAKLVLISNNINLMDCKLVEVGASKVILTRNEESITLMRSELSANDYSQLIELRDKQNTK